MDAEDEERRLARMSRAPAEGGPMPRRAGNLEDTARESRGGE
jgi:hypothetical protein